MARARNKKSQDNTQEVEVEVLDAGAELAAIEAALNGGLDIEIDDADFAEVDEAALVDAIEAEEAKVAAYDEQTSTVDISDADEAVEAPKSKRGATVNTADPAAFADAFVAALGKGAAFDSDEGSLDEDAIRNVAAGVTQKKVREKVMNLLAHVMNGATLSNYTKIALDIVVKAHADGCTPVTLAEIRKAYEDAGYKPGTVNAQAGQMMALFPQLRIADRQDRGVLKPNPNSVLLDALAAQ